MGIDPQWIREFGLPTAILAPFVAFFLWAAYKLVASIIWAAKEIAQRAGVLFDDLRQSVHVNTQTQKQIAETQQEHASLLRAKVLSVEQIKQTVEETKGLVVDMHGRIVKGA